MRVTKQGDNYWLAEGTTVTGHPLMVSGETFREAYIGFCAEAIKAAERAKA